MENKYVAPSLKVLGSLGELTLTKEKVEHLTPDGYSFMKIVLTS